MKRLVFDLTKISFLKRLISISGLIVEVLNDQNLFTESNFANWFLGYVQFCSGGHFSEPAEAACGKMNHLKLAGCSGPMTLKGSTSKTLQRTSWISSGKFDIAMTIYFADNAVLHCNE